jgi:Ser/Thr protein kinase RdoA (MazF antagonist)
VSDILPVGEPLYVLGEEPPRFARGFSFLAFQGVTLPETRLLHLDVCWHDALDFLEGELRNVKAALGEMQTSITKLPRGLVHSEGAPCNCGFDDEGELKVVFDLDSVRPGTAVEGIACTLASFSIDRAATVRRVRGRMAAMLEAMEGVSPLRQEERQALPAVIRLRYLEFAWHAVARLVDGTDRRPGFLKDDILALRWLRRHPEAVDLSGNA